jgi:hypothetical protein
MTDYLSADDFLTGITGREEDFDAPGLGLVRLRGLSVEEMRNLRKQAKGDELALMVNAVAVAMVQPKLPADAADKLLRAGVGYIDRIAARILELSGAKDREQLENLAGAGS